MGLLDKIREAELLKQRQAMTHRWMDNTKVSNPQDAKDFARGGLLGRTTDVLGMPFDIANMIYPMPKDFEWGTSDAIANGMGLLNGSKAETAGRIATGLLSPDLKNAAAVLPLFAGIFAGKSAKTAKLLDLSRAQDMEKAGEDARKIWSDTGWFKGADDKWRFEIDDSASELKRTLNTLKEGGFDETMVRSIDYKQNHNGTFDMNFAKPNPQTTSDILNIYEADDDLMGALMPQWAIDKMKRGEGTPSFIGDFEDAKRLDYAFSTDGMNALPANKAINHDELFSAYPHNNNLYVTTNPKMGTGGSYGVSSDGGIITTGNSQKKSTLLHELQHYIQDREGFAGGGSPKSFVASKDELLSKMEDLSEKINVIENTHIDEAMRILKRGDKEEINKIEGWLRGKNLITSDENLDVQSIAYWVGEQDTQYLRMNKELNKIKQNFHDIDPMRMYQRLAGEAEARAVQKRMNYTPEQRRSIFPFDDYDVPLDELIIK